VADDEGMEPDEDPLSDEDDEVLDDSQLFGPVIAWRHACRPRSSLPFRSSLLPNPAAAAPKRSAAEEPSRPGAVPELSVSELALPELESARVVSPLVAVLSNVPTSGLVRPI
jgi:hypothetical protein